MKTSKMNEKEPSGTEKAFMQGYACALSGLIYGHGEDTSIREALAAGGFMKPGVFKRYEIDPYDRKILAPVLRSMRKQRLNQ